MHKRPVVARTLARALGETASQRIWRSVVFAGAMLGTAACGGSSKPVEEPAAPVENADVSPTPAVAPAPEATPNPCAVVANPCAMPQAAAPEAAANPCAAAANPCAAAANPCAAAANPCAAPEADEKPKKKKRPRGGKDRPTGRGFILS
jgi:hypothetical protein